MCGIIGYVGNREAAPLLHEGLKRLEYRGYDSWGIAVLGSSYGSCGMPGGKAEIVVVKAKGELKEIEQLDARSLRGFIGIGHTRWATHGGVTDANAHPHLDCRGEIAVVHNGIIGNYAELRKELVARGHKFRSETDTECIVHLIEEEYGSSLEAALRKALGKVRGTYAIAVLSSREPGKLLCARNGSPLVLGLGQDETFLASDTSAFLAHTRRAVPMDDGEYAVIDGDGYAVKELASGRALKKKVLEVDWSIDVAEKEGYPHFMLKEIMEQPASIANSMNIYPEDIAALADMIDGADMVYLAAAGTSLHAAMVAEYWFAALCDKSVIAVDASEFLNKGVVDKNTLVVGITQSGETYDTLAAMRRAKSMGARTAAIVNVIGSTATRLADSFVLQGSGMEIAVCATKTFTGQLVILLRAALELGKRRKNKDAQRLEAELSKCPNVLRTVLEKREEYRGVADKYLGVRSYIYLGKGINLPSALEGALKFKEITYLHAEGMSGGLLKHGTISLIDEDTRTIAVVPAEGENRSRMMSNIQEVKARGGFVLGIASGEPLEECDVNIVAPKVSELLSPIVFAPIYQLLAYYTAVKLGRNVDKPRALAKSVTVE